MEDEIVLLVRVKPNMQEIEKRNYRRAQIHGHKTFPTPSELAVEVVSDALNHSLGFNGERPNIKVLSHSNEIKYDRESAHSTFNGGHKTEAELKAFHHGMDTVFNMIDSGAVLLK